MLSKTCAEPEPKKYRPEIKEKEKQTNSSLTDEERKFLREVEAKFGVKTDVSTETKKTDDDKKAFEVQIKPPFPAVIAIEIVNDTNIKSNGKRTIDANLGYGYKTDTGYAYTYLGRGGQEKGKFMIYPYSQEDIPAPHPNSYNSQKSSGHYTKSSTNVEIQPSRAYELVDVKDEQSSYQHSKHSDERTNYNNIQGLVSPPTYSTEHHQEPVQTSTPTTLYTTYNGEQFSGLSGQFPMVMPNYFVDPSQLLKYPQFQSAGLSQDHLHSSGSPLQQKVVPVLVLRVPSSYLKNPTAELYPNLPHNYPLSQYLNHVNLQELVNNYFKKIGYSSGPQIMAYQTPLLGNALQAPVTTPVTHYEPQHYATPHIQPSYTQADVAGVQYSAVKPVMAKYPLTYTRPQYYISSAQHTYQQPAQQYEYTYQYIPKSAGQQTYYIQPQYQTQTQVVSQEVQNEHVNEETSVQDTAGHVEYGVPQQETAHVTPVAPSVEYGTPDTQAAVHSSAQVVAAHYETANAPTQEYGVPKEENVEYAAQQEVTPDYGPTKVNLPVLYTTSAAAVQALAAQYALPQQKETIAVYPSQSGHIPRHYTTHINEGTQSYYYQKQVASDSSNSLVLSENYPSKDHTIATVLPVSYKQARKPNTATVQTVSYVTPMPYSHRFQSPYRTMVPQTILKNAEKVSYVNSHSLPYSQASSQENPEAEYTVPSHYVPPVGKQKPPGYPRNYHAHPKRMAKPEHKSDLSKKQIDRPEKKSA